MPSGVITCEQLRASEIGRGILAAGGNAVDAIIATTLAVHTLSPYHSDLGGGGFALIRKPDGTYDGLDFRQSAPLAANANKLKDFKQSDAVAVLVPGVVKGLEDLHKKYGKLPWKRLFKECIALAEDGFEMKQDLYRYTANLCGDPNNQDTPDRTNRRGSDIEHDRSYDWLFDRTDEILPPTSIVRRTEYAKTLREIADHGSAAFYEGPMAEATVKVVQDRGGILTMDDMARYKTSWVKPMKGDYQGKALWSLPAPAGGSIWIYALQILSHMEISGHRSLNDYHRLIEALKLAYPGRDGLGDPDFIEGLDEMQQKFIQAAYSKERSSLLDESKTSEAEYYQTSTIHRKRNGEDHGTSPLCAADGSGLIVCLTSTVGQCYGSHIIVPGYGFVMNDTLSDFAIKGDCDCGEDGPCSANYIGGGRRPLSSCCPYIVEDNNGRVLLAGAGAGGSTIISGNVQVVKNVLNYGLSAFEAVRSSRLHNQASPESTKLEKASNHQGVKIDGFANDIVQALRSRGHKIEMVPQSESTVVAIKFTYDTGSVNWEPAADTRKENSGSVVFYHFSDGNEAEETHPLGQAEG
ncbi:gamma-glutamyltranspeptidase [Kockovaella imperatae]|uniref:Glutathione hydrolase n=1 Tax=Kockovaella imperatae TaxID=4999 RepID=A0A1Y1UBK3_9TREE|nr:gamma-glutamyltranspeptidase [Kockovaella imperatae]ORX35421.1 gamma-glutamyltranspeptidase [Kockovaella imperatae]